MLLSLLLAAAVPGAAAAPQKESPLTVGGGIDAGAGASFPDGSPDPRAGAPQIEGDLGVRSGAFAMRIDLDLAVEIDQAGLAPLALTPEQAWLRVGGPNLFLAAGDFVAPWRRESVDPWDRGLTSTSMLSRKGLPTNLAGATFGGGTDHAGAEALVALDLGQGVNLLAPPATWAPQAPALLGAYGSLGTEVVEVGLGGFYRPGPRTGGLTLDAAVTTAPVRIEAQALAGLDAPHGATIAAEVLPRFVISPTARLEWYADQPGGALGIAVRPAPFIRLAAEGAYADGAPAVWIAADVFTPGTSRRTGDGGEVRR